MGYHVDARFHDPLPPDCTKTLAKAKLSGSSGVEELANRSLAESPVLRTDSGVSRRVGRSCIEPTAPPSNPNPATRASVRSRGCVASMRVAAAIPVKSHRLGWPARAWIPHMVPAATRPARVGPLRRIRGSRTHGSQP